MYWMYYLSNCLNVLVKDEVIRKYIKLCFVAGLEAPVQEPSKDLYWFWATARASSVSSWELQDLRPPAGPWTGRRLVAALQKTDSSDLERFLSLFHWDAGWWKVKVISLSDRSLKKITRAFYLFTKVLYLVLIFKHKLVIILFWLSSYKLAKLLESKMILLSHFT